MTSNEVTALGRPRRGGARRGLRFLIAALSLSLVVLAFSAMPVLAAETSTTTTTSSTETGYSQKPEVPAEKKVAPAKEEAKAPEKEVAPAKEAVTPVTAKALPFTGLDLRWVVGAGVLMLLLGGVSLRVVARRERHGIGR
jgi:uncharacterized membrane protein